MVHKVMGIKKTLETGSTSVSKTVNYVSIASVTLKFVEVVLGLACIGIAAYDLCTQFTQILNDTLGDVTARESTGIFTGFGEIFGAKVDRNAPSHDSRDKMICRIFFLVSWSVFTLFSFNQLVVCRPSLSDGAVLPRIFGGVIFHIVGFVFLLIFSVNLQNKAKKLGTSFINYEMILGASITGIVNSLLYFVSAILPMLCCARMKTCSWKSAPIV